MTITASQICNLLEQKHSEDVFIRECKNGPSQEGSHLRMDAWTMRKSWANPCVRAYEVKVSRSDFLQDEKWRGYLKYCNELVFCAPKGIIQVAELSQGVGLIEAVGARLVTRVKPAYRDVQIPESLYRYILMCRCRIGSEASDRGDEWRTWLETKAEHRDLGYRVARAIREHVDMVNRKCSALEHRHSNYESIREVLKRLNLPEDASAWTVDRAARGLSDMLPEHVVFNLKQLRTAVDVVLKECEPKKEFDTAP